MPRPLRVQNLFQGGFTEFRQTKLLLPDGKKCEWYSLVFSLVVYEPQKYARFTFDRQFAPNVDLCRHWQCRGCWVRCPPKALQSCVSINKVRECEEVKRGIDGCTGTPCAVRAQSLPRCTFRLARVLPDALERPRPPACRLSASARTRRQRHSDCPNAAPS
jgi:hypothetical protein